MEWVEIEGYEGLYSINKSGNVKNLVSGRILNGTSAAGHYRDITLTKGGFRKRFYIHRLIAMVFIPNPNNLPVVNHINGNKCDNRIENLEWCTQKENLRKHFGYESRNNSCLTAKESREIEQALMNANVSSICRKLGIKRQATIYEAMNGKSRNLNLLRRVVKAAKDGNNPSVKRKSLIE